MMRQPPLRVDPRRPGPGRIVWLCGYPASGSSWLRDVVVRLRPGPVPTGAAPSRETESGPVVVSDSAAGAVATVATPPGPTPDDLDLRQTHHPHPPDPLAENAFPAGQTRAAVLIVRDPRDVACDLASRFGLTWRQAVAVISGDAVDPGRANPELSAGSWSDHTASWLDDQVPFPVHLVRHEDLLLDPVDALGPVLDAVGLTWRAENLIDATRGTRSRRGPGMSLIPYGRVGAWRDRMPTDMVRRLQFRHDEVMCTVGYGLVDTPQTFPGPPGATATVADLTSARSTQRERSVTQ